MKNKIYSIIAIAAITITMHACKKEKTVTNYTNNANCSAITQTYNNNIKTILDNNCASSGCHNAGSSKAGINLSDYSNAKSQFLNNNKNLIAIHHDNGAKAMPKDASKMADSLINKIDCWVKGNCPE